MSTGIGELDRVLGGGLVPGSLVLLGGSPGIGKSTLTNMALANLLHAGRARCTSAARSPPSRSGCAQSGLAPGALDVPVLAETDLATVLAILAAHAPRVCVIDSVQTLNAAGLSGAPGSVGQVREVAGQIMQVAKARGMAVILVGHVTKEGALAGPRVLEHLVDCVLQFEGERERPYRELRALKNRFGSTHEAGLFEMRQGGLVEVLDASARFVAEATRAPGSVVLAAMEGSRPLLVEVQALVAPSELEQPRRVVSGLHRNRLALVLAILRATVASRRAARTCSSTSSEECAWTSPAATWRSPWRSRAPSRGVALTDAPRACFGELGLTGELRWVGHPERRLQEAARHRPAAVIAPPDGGAQACEVATLAEALACALPGRDAVSVAAAA